MAKADAKQGGAALLLMVVVVVMAATALYLSAATNTASPQQTRQNEITKELIAAKESLLAYAVMYADNNPHANGRGPGRLPCPTFDGVTCVAFGRLPTQATVNGTTFVFSSLTDPNDQLWYGVSDSFLFSATPVRSNTATQRSLDGNDYVAVIVAPGSPLSFQDRTAVPINAVDYLESTNSAGVAFVSRLAPPDPIPANYDGEDTFNDRAIGITRSELMTPVTLRVAQEMKRQIDIYHEAQNKYPATVWTVDGLIQCAINPSGVACQNARPFSNVVDAATWAGTEWLGITTYARITNDQATLVFTNCSIRYTLDFAQGISRVSTAVPAASPVAC